MATAKATTMYGRINEFEAHNEDWETYVERVEMFFDANGTENDKHVAILLSCVGAKTYGLLKSLTAPAKPSEKSYKEIVDILKNHLNPKPLVIGERFRFWKRDQKCGESVSSYIAQLKNFLQSVTLAHFSMRLFVINMS